MPGDEGFLPQMESEDSFELPHQVSIRAYLQLLPRELYIEDGVSNCFGFRQMQEQDPCALHFI